MTYIADGNHLDRSSFLTGQSEASTPSPSGDGLSADVIDLLSKYLQYMGTTKIPSQRAVSVQSKEGYMQQQTTEGNQLKPPACGDNVFSSTPPLRYVR